MRPILAGILALTLTLLLASLLVAASQAPTPPQAPPIPVSFSQGEKECCCGEHPACNCATCDLNDRNCYPKKTIVVKSAGSARQTQRADGSYCSPGCTCGCNEGGPCICGVPTTGRTSYGTYCPVDGYAMYPKTALGGALVLACPVCSHEEPLTGPAARPPTTYQFAPQTQPYAPSGYYAAPFGDGGCAGGSCGAPAGRGVFRRR